MGLEIEYTDGQTPLEEEEKEGLRIQTISTRGELDEFEQKNIEQALQWTMGRSFNGDSVFTEEFICNVHKRMYGDVWSWAGKFRRSEKNIGIEFWKIPAELKKLLDDARYWLEHKTYPPDEIAIRFKHRLVSIHCFPNGNGRHSRLMADIIADNLLKGDPFSWGTGYANSKDARAAYLPALKAADKGDYDLLLRFARS
jgi:Fic-DOC domain mobile mystery protein B